VNTQSCVGYQVYCGMIGVVLGKSRDVRIVQDATVVINTGAIDNADVGGKEGYIYSSFCDLIHILCLFG
jgi:hypothetical protein